MRTVAQMKAHLEGVLGQAEGALSEWKGKFERSAIYALEWSDAIYLQAARQELAANVLGHIAFGEEKGMGEGVIMNEITISYLRELMHKGSLNTNHSTGQGQNLLDGARVQALAEFMTWLNRF